ncbi:MAG TPA: hypothetical protein VFE36_08770 [Candidatus Baltobacteraceae bacterium]|jgi:hypothetical protein|nr:hypothetical protein [Candidatus Baltobacteraceae bacterium]
MKTLRFGLFITAIALNACGGPSSGSNAVPSSASAVLTPHVTAQKFTWVSKTGSAGQTVGAKCPTGFRLVGGASSSVDGSPVGIGWGKPLTNTWNVDAGSNATRPIAIASCVGTSVSKSTFKWLVHPSGGGVATVQCPSGYVLISGFAKITAKGQQISKTYVQGNNAFFVTGGASAGASCGKGAAGIATFTKWNTSQDPKQVYSACPTGFSVIGGNTGSSQWPGPPIQQHRGTSAPGVVGSAGWWVLSNGKNVVSYAVCVPNGT